VTDVNADKHSLFTDLRSKGHSPQVTAKLSVHLSNDIEEDTVVVLSNSAIGHKLRDNRRITVDLVFDERVEVLVIRMVRHNHQEDELGVADGTVTVTDRRCNLLVVVVLDGLGKRFKKNLLVEGGFIRNWADIGVLYSNSETLRGRKIVELVVDIVCIHYISL